jgi:hypothetical protein
MPYHNPLSSSDDIEGFRLEGDGAVSFPRGRLRLESLRPPEDGQDASVSTLWRRDPIRCRRCWTPRARTRCA